MQFKQYPSYKPSGVEWLGDVPEHWQQKPIWSLFKRIKRTNFPTERLLSVYRDYGVIPKDSRDDNHNRASEDLTPYQLVCANDLVINKMKAWQGSIAISELRGIVSPAYYIYQPKAEYHSKYIHFLIRSAYYIQSYKNYSKGIRVNQWDLESEAFTHIDLLLPSLDEQQKIVAFLDTETTRIDNLIAKQEKLIELLEEQRKSIISHAVTKGLNPNAPMKDSGVEWLGEVPEHWDVKSYRFVSKIYRGKFGHRPRNDPSLYDGEYPFIQTGDVARAGKYIQTYSQTLNEKGKAVSQVFTSGTLVMAIAANIGDTAILNFEAYAPDSVVGFKPHKNIDLEFLRFSFIASLQALEQTAVQSTQANLNVERIGALKTTFPPLSEQIEISNYLNAENEKNNHLISKQNQLIEKLKEYRASIISHAVTGKIDVREFGA